MFKLFRRLGQSSKPGDITFGDLGIKNSALGKEVGLDVSKIKKQPFSSALAAAFSKIVARKVTP